MKPKSTHQWGRETARERYDFACGGAMKKADGGPVPMPKPRPAGVEPQPSDLYSPEQVKKLESRSKLADGGDVPPLPKKTVPMPTISSPDTGDKMTADTSMNRPDFLRGLTPKKRGGRTK